MRPENDAAQSDRGELEETENSVRPWARPKIRRLMTSAAEINGGTRVDGVESLS